HPKKNVTNFSGHGPFPITKRNKNQKIPKNFGTILSDQPINLNELIVTAEKDKPTYSQLRNQIDYLQCKELNSNQLQKQVDSLQFQLQKEKNETNSKQFQFQKQRDESDFNQRQLQKQIGSLQLQLQ